MNAIASSVNKGALKVAPKAGTARRSRQPSSAPKAPSVEPASKQTSTRVAKSIPQSDDDWTNKSTNESRTATRSVPIVTSTNIASDKLKKSAIPDSFSPHEPTETLDGEASLAARESTDDSATLTSDLVTESASKSKVGVHKPQRSTTGRTAGPFEGFDHETTDISSSELSTARDHTHVEERMSSEKRIGTDAPTTTLGDNESQSGSRKRKRTTASTRARHVKREATPDEAEHELIDTTGLKMIDLCKDMRTGKKSSKHDEFVRIAAQRRRLHRDVRAAGQGSQPEVSELLPEGANVESGVINGKNLEVEDENSATHGEPNPIADLLESHDQHGEYIENPDDESSDHGNEAEEPSNKYVTSRDRDLINKASAPQVRIVNGQIVLDVNSLQVDRALRDARADGGGSIEYVEENPLEKIVNSRSYSKHKLPSRWDVASTELFYEGLSQWGTDFDMISRMFPLRDRKQIKNKFTIEERRNPGLVTQALIQKKPVDMDEYSKMSATIFRPITELEEEEN